MNIEKAISVSLAKQVRKIVPEFDWEDAIIEFISDIAQGALWDFVERVQKALPGVAHDKIRFVFGFDS